MSAVLFKGVTMVADGTLRGCEFGSLPGPVEEERETEEAEERQLSGELESFTSVS